MTQREWIDAQIAANSDRDPYWHYMKCLMGQYDNMKYGYGNATRELDPALPALDDFAFAWLNAHEELYDVLTSMGLQQHVHVWWRWWQRNGHCSAMVKVTPTFVNLRI